MSSKMAWLGSAATFTLGLILIYFARDISEFITAPFLNHSNAEHGHVIGAFEDTQGPAFLKPNESVREIRLNSRLPLKHLDQIRTEAGAQVILNLESGWRLQLTENSTAIFEAYRPNQKNSPILMSLVRGDYQVLSEGPNGLLFVGRDKKIFLPQNKPEPNVHKMTIVQTPLPETQIEALPSEAPVAPKTILPSAKTKGPLPDKLPVGHEETLTSAYIESVLAQEASTFRRCQMNSVRDNRPSLGTLLVSLTIVDTGAVKNTRVLQNEMQNETLSQCVLSAIGRVKFKEFEGLPITLTYPIEFK